MARINVELKGADKLIRKINRFGDVAKKEVEGETMIAAENIVTNAKLAAPVGTPESTGIKGYIGGTLRQSIAYTKVEDLTYRIFAAAKYAPYIEFGTGGKVMIPPGFESLAAQFKGRGIRAVNLRARPFLYPAWKSEGVKYIAQLKKILKDYGKDISG